MRKNINGDACHQYVLAKTERSLAFREEADYDSWREAVREKLTELLGIGRIKENFCELNIDIEEESETDSYKKIRFTFESERAAVVPAYLLIPKTGKASYPVAICLQGHTGGFHHSIGEIKAERDKRFQPNAAQALQAVERGFAALAIEQRAMGEQASSLYPNPTVHACAIAALTALNLGRTVIGERVWDVHRAIDALGAFEGLGLDLGRIMIIGHSGGGTATYYSACFDERIGLCAPGGAFCTFKDSIMDIHHCVCNYIPDICNCFEMGELSCLIAPRSLVVLTGRADEIFPIDGVREAFSTVERIYSKAGAEGGCHLAESEEGHVFSIDVFWDAVMKEARRLGWFGA